MSSSARPEIRLACAADAAAIAEINVLSWQAVYAGQLPEDYLDNLSISDRQHRWEQILSEPARPGHVFIITKEDLAVGFAAIGPSSDDDAPANTGELHAIYLHPAYWNRGLGRLLHDHALAALSNDGHRHATLWVLRTNSRAHRFYHRSGWLPDGATKIDTIDSLVLEEVRYHRTLDSPALRVSPGGPRR
jgi:GNAT superfamily N-acetyltransferase